MNNTTEYIPGICNINPKEVKRRRMIGISGLIAVAIIAALLIPLNIPPAFRAIIFIPAFIMATGFLQARAKFCVGYASAGMQHVGKDFRHIEDEAALRLDKNRAKKINIQSFLTAAAITALFIFLAR